MCAMNKKPSVSKVDLVILLQYTILYYYSYNQSYYYRTVLRHYGTTALQPIIAPPMYGLYAVYIHM